MNIRLATEEDLPVINTIYNQAVMQKFCTAHLAPVGEVSMWTKHPGGHIVG